MTGPNVILICVDEWRGDALSCAGHPHVETPYIDDLARRGTRFARAYSATPTCVPARVGLFTGQSQERHGRVGYSDAVPFDVAHPTTVQGEFRKAGYQTQAIGKLHVFPERSRVGFDDVLLHDGYLHFSRRHHGGDFAAFDDYVPWLRQQANTSAGADYFDNGMNCNSLVTRPWHLREELHPTHWLGTQAVHWFDRRDPTRPFFLYLSFHRPHAPYDPPQWALDKYLDLPPYERELGDWEADWDGFREDGHTQATIGDIPDRTVHRARAGYYGLITQIDLQINRILESLAAHGLHDDTVVAFVSDHGEMMGDHRMFRKGLPYEGSAHIPFIVAGAPANGSTRRVVEEVVELRDIMPTLLELAGLPCPPSVDGVSLAQHITAGNAESPREWLHGEHQYWEQSIQWVTDGRVKYVWGSAEGIEQLFDLRTDPREMHDLSNDPQWDVARAVWRGRLIEALADREEGFVQDGKLVTGRPVTTVLRHTRDRIATVDTQLAERLAP